MQYVCLSANVLSFRWCIDKFWCWFSILFISVYVKMVYFCCVNGCKTEWYPGCGLSFHRMPKDESVAEKWKQIIPGTITKTSVVCNLHFKDQDFVNEFKKRLKGNAVPSIFPKVFAAEKKIYVLSNIQLNEPSTSEPPEKKQKIQEQLDKSLQTENLITPREKKLKREIKILSQRLKRRNTTINNLKSLLSLIKKKCNSYSEVKDMIELNFQNIHEKINETKSSRGNKYSDSVKSFALTTAA